LQKDDGTSVHLYALFNKIIILFHVESFFTRSDLVKQTVGCIFRWKDEVYEKGQSCKSQKCTQQQQQQGEQGAQKANKSIAETRQEYQRQQETKVLLTRTSKTIHRDNLGEVKKPSKHQSS